MKLLHVGHVGTQNLGPYLQGFPVHRKYIEFNLHGGTKILVNNFEE